MLLALIIGGAGAAPLAGLLLLTGFGLGLYARHWFALAGRSCVGAGSEDEVQRALAPLWAEGWRLLARRWPAPRLAELRLVASRIVSYATGER